MISPMPGGDGGNGNGTAPVAAVDLGSNSFHLIIGREIDGSVAVLDRLRDPVRLAAGLDERGMLSEETQERMLASLRRFEQRLREVPPERTRAIGTNTLRRAKGPPGLLERASEALGVPIEVLSGYEEARLIYLGVSHAQPHTEGRRLVVDIGGGSTECILGEGFTPLSLESLYMGCVSWSLRFFPEGRITRRGFRDAETAAKLELETIERRFRELGWSSAYGSSGTIGAVAAISEAAGWSEGRVTLAGIKKLRKALIAAGDVRELSLPGLAADRAAVLPGGVAILKAVFEALGIEAMAPSRSALREGVLYDLLGRIRHEDVRDRTIRSLSQRFAVDEEQAARVERTALASLDQLAAAWELERPEHRRLLSWGARMHEIGLALSHHGYHKHGAYVLAHAAMPGFSRQDQERLAALVRGHRRRFGPFLAAQLPPAWRDPILRLCVLLRIAVRLNRTRSDSPLPPLRLAPTADGLALSFPPGWLEHHPLTRADLEEEDAELSAGGLRLHLGPPPDPDL